MVKTTGFPVMIKAAAGGGGRGIRIARSAEEFHHLMPQAQAEALAAFGDGGVYVEKLIEGARHIEVQVLGDGHDVIHCFERECSLQRRRQKVWEEAPSPSLTPAIREKLCSSAVALAKAVNYRGAGTIEYLYDDRSHEFYFLEMNTRIQVEHPVTEMVTGIDLVREMIRIAGGERLRFRQDQVRDQWPLDRGPHQRGGCGERLHAEPGHRHRHSTCRVATACASTACSIPATRCRHSMTACSAS